MQQELKLGYKEYLVALKYSALKFIEHYGPEQEIEVFYDSISKRIVSIIEMPYRFQIKNFKTTLGAFVIYVTTVTNRHLDPTLITIRLYRYFQHRSQQDYASKLGLTLEEYIKYERGSKEFRTINPNIFTKLEIPQINIDLMENLK